MKMLGPRSIRTKVQKTRCRTSAGRSQRACVCHVRGRWKCRTWNWRTNMQGMKLQDIKLQDMKMQDMKLQDMQRQSRKLAQKRQTSESIAFYANSCSDSRIVEDQSRSGLSHRLEHTRNSLIDVTPQRVYQRRRWRRRPATSHGIACCSDWDDFHFSGDTGSSCRQLLWGVSARASHLCRAATRVSALLASIESSIFCPAISCLANASKNGPSISCPAISVNPPVCVWRGGAEGLPLTEILSLPS